MLTFLLIYLPDEKTEKILHNLLLPLGINTIAEELVTVHTK